MAEPLNYRNARGPEQSDDSPKPQRNAGPRDAIPVEFDTLLTRTTDLAAAAAIEKLLTAQKIPFHRTDDGRAVDRVVELYVSAADQPRAGEFAVAIFVRRKKFKAMPRPEMPDLPNLPGEW